MKRLGCMFVAIILSLALVITPVMAKGGAGGGNSSGGGKGSSVSTSNSGGGNKASSVSPGNSGNKGSAKEGKSVSADNSKSDKTNNGQGKSNSGNKSGVVKDSKAGNNKIDSGKKVKDAVDLTRGNKEAVQQRLQSKEAKTVKKQFKDATDHWAQNSIQKVQKIGLIQGYEDGSFRPDATVNQVEAMVMVINLSEMINNDSLINETDADETTSDDQITDETVDETTTDETDENIEDDDSVSNGEEETADVPAWARNQARKANMMKIININRFHSEVQASRAQVAVMLSKALELEPVEVDEKAFTDSLKISPEDIGYILALKEAGIISGTPDGKFNPNSAITRAQLAAMLAKVVDNVEDEEEEENGLEEEPTVPDEDTDNNEGTDPVEDTNTAADETQPDTENTGSESADDPR